MDMNVHPQRMAPGRSKPRILFVGEAVSLAHVGRPAVLANWARAAGFDVHFACGSALASVARAEGLTPLPLHTIASKTFYTRLNEGSFFYTSGELEDYVRSEMRLIEEVSPDLIVGDFRLTLSMSSTLMDVPLLALNNAHWNPAAACRFSAPNSPLFRALPGVIRERVFSMVRPVAFRVFGKPLNNVRRRFGLPEFSDFREHYTAGRHCAYLDLPELAPLEAPPVGHFFLGPVAWEPRNLAAPALDRVGRVRPLAYVTLGSTGDVFMLPTVLYALLRTGFDIALSGVNSEQSAMLHQTMPELYTRCVAATLFNPSEVLKRAAITVCHGGSGTVYQSLAAGVPMLCLPGNPDQGLVSASVFASGAGLMVPASRATLPALKRALTRLLHDGNHTQAAKGLARSIANFDTRQQWQNFLDSAFPTPFKRNWQLQAQPDAILAPAGLP